MARIVLVLEKLEGILRDIALGSLGVPAEVQVQVLELEQPVAYMLTAWFRCCSSKHGLIRSELIGYK